MPESWEWTNLGDITNYGNCENVDVNDIPKEGWVLELEDLEKDSAKIIQQLTKDERDIKGVRHSFHKGDVLYSKLRTYLNKVMVANEDGFCTTEIIPITCMSYVLPEYLNHVLRSKYFVDYTIQCGYGVKMPRLSTTDACNGQIPLPPYNEQKHIVASIEGWFQLIDILESDQADLDEAIQKAKSKILDLAIHGKLVPQDPNDEPAIELLKRINPKFTPCDNAHKRNQIPDSWIWCTLQDSFKITMGSSPTGDTLNREKLGIEFHQGKVFFSNKYILPSDIYSTQPVKLAEPLSILLCVRAPVGTVNITDRQICIGRGLCSLIPSKSIDLQYAYYVLQTCSEELEQKATGSTFKAVGGDVVKNQIIPLPPINEQRRIVAKIEGLYSVLDEIQKSIEA